MTGGWIHDFWWYKNQFEKAESSKRCGFHWGAGLFHSHLYVTSSRRWPPLKEMPEMLQHTLGWDLAKHLRGRVKENISSQQPLLGTDNFLVWENWIHIADSLNGLVTWGNFHSHLWTCKKEKGGVFEKSFGKPFSRKLAKIKIGVSKKHIYSLFYFRSKKIRNQCWFFWEVDWDWDPECPGYRSRMDQDEAMTAVNVCRAVGLFHMHGPQAMVFNWAVWGEVGDGLGLLFCKDWRYLLWLWQLIKEENSKKADGRYAISLICVVVGCFFFCKRFFCRIRFVFIFRVLECTVTPKQVCRMIFRMIVCMWVIVL